jgi:hypothetical protein
MIAHPSDPRKGALPVLKWAHNHLANSVAIRLAGQAISPN